MAKDDASDWSLGDMQRDQDEYEVTAQSPYANEDKANEVARMLRRAALRNKTGALIEVKRESGRNGHWIVKVYSPRKK
jgi:predicted N-formylglutamate amidohydrolase